MITAGIDAVGEVCAPGAGAPTSEELVLLRAGGWRMLVPVSRILRIHPAAMPVARPSAEPSSPIVAIDGELLPVAFAASLAGAAKVELSAQHQLVELGDGARRGLLWVDAAEDVVPFEPSPGTRPDDALVAGWSGAERPLPILDVAHLLDLLCGPAGSAGKEPRP